MECVNTAITMECVDMRTTEHIDIAVQQEECRMHMPQEQHKTHTERYDETSASIDMQH